MTYAFKSSDKKKWFWINKTSIQTGRLLSWLLYFCVSHHLLYRMNHIFDVLRECQNFTGRDDKKN